MLFLHSTPRQRGRLSAHREHCVCMCSFFCAAPSPTRTLPRTESTVFAQHTAHQRERSPAAHKALCLQVFGQHTAYQRRAVPGVHKALCLHSILLTNASSHRRPQSTASARVCTVYCSLTQAVTNVRKALCLHSILLTKRAFTDASVHRRLQSTVFAQHTAYQKRAFTDARLHSIPLTKSERSPTRTKHCVCTARS